MRGFASGRGLWGDMCSQSFRPERGCHAEKMGLRWVLLCPCPFGSEEFCFLSSFLPRGVLPEEEQINVRVLSRSRTVSKAPEIVFICEEPLAALLWQFCCSSSSASWTMAYKTRNKFDKTVIPRMFWSLCLQFEGKLCGQFAAPASSKMIAEVPSNIKTYFIPSVSQTNSTRSAEWAFLLEFHWMFFLRKRRAWTFFWGPRIS